jgi:hypothetical protein
MPGLSAALSRSGSGVRLDVDPDVLVAYDEALKADTRGQHDPSAAADAWRRLARMEGTNPYRQTAADRQKQWQDFATQTQALANQKRDDTARLRKILPLTSISVEDKKQLLATYRDQYGVDALLDLLPAIEPLDGRASICRALAADVTRPLAIQAKDAGATVVAAKVSLAGKVIGTTPFSAQVGICEEKLDFNHPTTGEWISEPLPRDGRALRTVQVTFRCSTPQTALLGTAWVEEDGDRMVTLLGTNGTCRYAAGGESSEIRIGCVWSIRNGQFHLVRNSGHFREYRGSVCADRMSLEAAGREGQLHMFSWTRLPSVPESFEKK